MVKSLTLALLLVISAFFASGQGNSQLLLRNGTLDMPANGQEFAREYKAGPGQVFMGRYYLVMQFEAIPTQQMREEIESMGIRFLEYLPQRAFLASIPENFDLQQLVDRGVRSFRTVGHEIKLSPEIYQMKMPEWAKSGNEVDVVVRLYGDVDKSMVIDWIASRYQIISEYPHPTLTTVRAHPMRLMELYAQPFVQYLEPIAAPSTPDDIEGRSLHRSNAINSDYGAGRHYDGTGMTIGLADDGIIGPHIDYTGRVTQFATGNTGNHGDMTSGILFGAGNRDPKIRGHATGAYLYYWDISGYVHIVSANAHYSNYNMTLTSTSYSQGTGGVYTSDAQFIDNQVVTNPRLIHVFSAGNAGTANHGYGAGAGWGNITGGYKAAKHVVTCANLRNNDQLENSSSRGPADDGRIKPDISANGYDQLSTDANNTNQVGGGTSAAAPSVAGTLTQLMHAYKSLNSGQEPETYLIKACALNTAEDLGNPGPDYKHGWGRINALRAVRIMENNQYLKDSVTQGQSKTHTITVPANTGDLRVMCYWLDPAGSPSAAIALVNDLTLTVTAPSSTVYNCWKLDPTPNATILNTPAVRGMDSLNTMEQVTLTNPAAGTYTVTVAGTSVPMGPQPYYIVYEFRPVGVEMTYPIGGEGFDPGTTEIVRWDATEVTGTFSLDYSTDGGSTWTNFASNLNNNLRQYTWNIPNLLSGQARVRVTNGAYSDMSDADFTFVNTPSGLSVVYVCPDSIGLTWNAVTGATGYEVSMLGTSYMDSVGTTTSTSFAVTGQNPNLEHWFSVKALTANNGAGQRAVAIMQTAGTSNCTVPIDAALEAVINPGAGYLPSCQVSASDSVRVTVKNYGTSNASNIGVHYRLNGGAVVNATVAGPLAPGGSVQYTFAQTINLATPGTYTLESWVSLPGDGNIYNDSVTVVSQVSTSTPVTLPVSEDFESFGSCGTNADCEATTCPLGNGWVNVSNGTSDDIDWRVDAGGTPSTGTGPSIDHSPGNSTGKYVYLEASNGCIGKTAILLSPCIDLTGISNPELSFWYHMLGINMGSLHLDILSEGVWQNDVIFAISGDQGNAWSQVLFNLAPWAGKVINIRIRGITGSEYASDMALDDITISAASSAPAASFEGSPLITCVGNTVTFADQSTNAPTAWNWTITPSTFVFVGGTSASSQNPQVQFSATGLYTVSLTATNVFGSNTYTIPTYININSGASAPLFEGFQGSFLPTGWSIIDPGGSFTWTKATGINGPAGSPTDAAFVENYNYNSPGAEDELVTMTIDLGNASLASLDFDLAYCQYSATLFDGLRIDISTDCGQTFTPTSYNKSGPALATAPDNTANWSPASAGEWRGEFLDLTPYVGNSVVLKFVNINGYGNNLYVDNINISVTVGRDNPGFGPEVSIYPNPGDGNFNVVVAELPAGAAVYTVHDLAGRLVYEHTVESVGGSHRMPLSLSHLPQGVYYFQLNAEEMQVVKKLVIQ